MSRVARDSIEPLWDSLARFRSSDWPRLLLLLLCLVVAAGSGRKTTETAIKLDELAYSTRFRSIGESRTLAHFSRSQESERAREARTSNRLVRPHDWQYPSLAPSAATKAANSLRFLPNSLISLASGRIRAFKWRRKCSEPPQQVTDGAKRAGSRTRSSTSLARPRPRPKILGLEFRSHRRASKWREAENPKLH